MGFSHTECPGEIYDDFDYLTIDALLTDPKEIENIQVDHNMDDHLNSIMVHEKSEMSIHYNWNLSDLRRLSAIISFFFVNNFKRGTNIYKSHIDVVKNDQFNSIKTYFIANGFRLYSGSPSDDYDYILYKNDNLIIVSSFSGQLSRFYIYGDHNNFDEIENKILSYCPKWKPTEHSTLSWCFLDDSNKISVTESILEVKNPPFTEMYPFLSEETLEEYYERYNESSASILLLQGPPGTGKTTFIRGLLHHTNKSALLSYDDAILRSDNFLNLFIKNKAVNFLIFEDADAYLNSRESGNRVIHKFLNAGDGLISTKNKKIIFTTNLQNIDQIDTALTRPGRCFDILQFRPLNKEETNVVYNMQGFMGELPKNEYTIAEIFNQQKYTKNHKKTFRGFE